MVMSMIGTQVRHGNRPFWPLRMNRHSPQSRGLRLWYPMIPWVDAYDFSDSKLHLTNNGKNISLSQFQDFAFGAQSTGAASAYFEVADIPDISDFPTTITMWMQFTSAADDFWDTYGHYAVGGDGTIALGNKDNGTMMYSAKGVTCSTSTSITVGVWHHVAGRSISATDHAVFLDGGGKGTSTGSATNAWANADRTTIGRNGETGGSGAPAYIADCRTYDRALSDAELFELWHPATRWDLYAKSVPRMRLNVLAEAVGVDELIAATQGAGFPAMVPAALPVAVPYH